uniref:Secreted protein n=1 Tax=Panagrolaimus sp. JU765 TaxID=591449 RepID=A0AC34RNG6_9BILA
MITARLTVLASFIVCFFVIFCKAWPTRHNDDRFYLVRLGPQTLINFPDSFLSKAYLFNSDDLSTNDDQILMEKRNIAIGRGDGFRPGK